MMVARTRLFTGSAGVCLVGRRRALIDKFRVDYTRLLNNQQREIEYTRQQSLFDIVSLSLLVYG